MEKIIHYFQTIPSLDRALILAGGITFFWILEGIIPLFRFNYNRWKHAGVNIFFTLTTIAVNFLFAILIVFASDYSQQHHTGVLQWLHLPLWATIIAGLLILDFISAYLIHWIEHKVKWMWKFHMIHHADTHVDTTTANRHHPGESVFRAVFTLIAVLVSGSPIWLVMMYQSMSVVFSQFNHANIRFPEKIDKVLRWIIVTPRMHLIHHHYIRPETDTNYGNIFSFWDRIFRTYHHRATETLNYGLDVFGNRNDSDIKTLLKLPFDKDIKTDYGAKKSDENR